MKKLKVGIITTLGIATGYSLGKLFFNYKDFKDNKELDKHLTIIGQLKLLTNRINHLGEKIKEIQNSLEKNGNLGKTKKKLKRKGV